MIKCLCHRIDYIPYWWMKKKPVVYGRQLQAECLKLAIKIVVCRIIGHTEGAFHRPGGGYMGGSYNEMKDYDHDAKRYRRGITIWFCQRCFAKLVEEKDYTKKPGWAA